MIPIPLPTTIEGARLTPKHSRYTNNLIPSQDALLSRPACTKVETLAVGQPRGIFEFKGVMYSVFGQNLFRGTNGLTRIGKIDGTGKISVAVDFEKVAIATGESNYILGTELVKIYDRDLPACRSVCVIDGIFVWVPLDGSPVCWSEIGRPSQIRAASFFDAEQLPDKNRICANIRNDLFIFGDESIERFRNIGDASQPFVRVNGSIVSVGFVGGLVETQDSFLFIGQDKDGGFAVYVFDSAQVVQISSEAINEILNTQYTITDLRNAEGQRFNWHGKDCYVFSIKDRDFIVTRGATGFNWGYLSSGSNKGFFEFDKWGYRNAKFHKNSGKWFCQRSDGLFEFTYDDKDTDGEFIRSFRTYISPETRQMMILNSMKLGVAQTHEKGSVGLSMSRDGLLYCDPFFVPTGGQYDNEVVFGPAGGLGYYDGYAGIQISTTSNIAFAVDSIIVS